MRVTVLGEPGGWHVERLAAALIQRGHDVAVTRWSELSAEIHAGEHRCGPPDIDAADAIVVRGMPGISAGPDRLEEVIFRMDALGQLAARGVPVINRPRALEIAIDKYLSLAVLCDHGIPVPRTMVVQNAAAAVRAWGDLGHDCIAKPIFGSRGRGLVRLRAESDVLAAIPVNGRVSYLQEFIPHAGWDVRVLVVGERVFSMKRVAASGDWRTNVSQGGRPEAFAAPRDWIELALRAATAVGAEIAGVDLLPTGDGRVLVLEVNAVPGWRGLQEVEATDLAGAVAAAIEDAARR
ncbi:MAG: ATP-grasp domain-containing protein [Pirellulales bacterium]